MQLSQSGGGIGPCAVMMQLSQSGGGIGPCETGPLLVALESSVTHIKRDPPISLLFTKSSLSFRPGTHPKVRTKRHSLA